MLALLLPVPITNDRPVVWLRLSRPLVTDSVICTGALAASRSATLGLLAPESTSAVSSLTDAKAGRVTTGASLTGKTFTVKVVSVVLLPSETETVMVAAPPLALLLALASGARLRVRLPLLPPSVILPLGISAWLLDVAVTTSAAGAVSASVMTKPSGPRLLSSFIVWLAIAVTVGARPPGLNSNAPMSARPWK